MTSVNLRPMIVDTLCLWAIGRIG